MSAFISMLRGVNVGGQKRLTMESLRELYIGLDFSEVKTYLQSGNVVFKTAEMNPVELASRIEKRIQETYGYAVAVFIRQPAEFEHLLSHNSFYSERHEDPTRLHVTFLYQAPGEAAWDKVIAPPGISDEFAHAQGAVYLFCPNGYGKTKLSNDFFERKLGVLATTRNWNTVNALYNMSRD